MNIGKKIKAKFVKAIPQRGYNKELTETQSFQIEVIKDTLKRVFNVDSGSPVDFNEFVYIGAITAVKNDKQKVFDRIALFQKAHAGEPVTVQSVIRFWIEVMNIDL